MGMCDIIPFMKAKQSSRYSRQSGPPHVSPERWEQFCIAFKEACVTNNLLGQRNWRARAALKESMLREWGILAYWDASEWKARLLARAKRGAAGRDIEFHLTESDLELPLKCPVFGCDLNYISLATKVCPETPSVDRIDNSKGYIPGNVHVISFRANKLKNDATLAELISLGQWASHARALFN
jgi:hypothetical protein